jgi:hypothetical protein
MSSLWPWVAVAGAGALHGLNPATGWMLAAGCGLRTGDRRQALRALVPIAAGHAASVVMVAAAVALGHVMEDWARPVMGAAVLVLVLMLFFRGPGRRAKLGKTSDSTTATGRIGMALWSFVASTAHGSGMMLVPALVPLCLSNSPAREITASGSLLLALAAVAVHALAMLGTLGFVAVGTVCGFAKVRRWCAHRSPSGRDGHWAWPMASSDGFTSGKSRRQWTPWGRSRASGAKTWTIAM